MRDSLSFSPRWIVVGCSVLVLCSSLAIAGGQGGEEPSDVLNRQSALVARGGPAVLAHQPEALNQEISGWHDLVEAYPSSDMALDMLATLQSLKGDVSGNARDYLAAADSYIRAADRAFERGRVHYTREISKALVAANDVAALQRAFGRLLPVARTMGPGNYVVALIDYADGLARLGRPEAATYFEQAIQATPVPLIEAVNRYAQYLLDRRDARAVLTLLDRMTPTERMMSVLPVYLRRQALLQLGLDTRSADEEIAAVQSRAQGATGGVPAPPPPSASPR